MAENMDVSINITGNAQQQLSKIQKQVDQVSNSFEKMKAALGSLAIGAMIHQVAAFADDITDTADAFGLATSEVLAFSSALAASGGKGENAVKIFQGIATSVDELNNGNIKTLQSFEQLGFSLSELGQLTEAEIRDKVIVQLGEMSNKTEAAALAMKIFGKAAIGVDFSKLADEIKNNQDEAKRFAGAIETAGNAFDNMEKITKQIKLAFADAFQPVFKMISAIKFDTEDLSLTFKVLGIAILSIATAITAVRIATTAATTAMALFNTVSSANPWILGAKAIIAGLTAAGILIATNTDEQKASNDETEKGTGEVSKQVVKTEELSTKLKQQHDAIVKIGQDYKLNTQVLQAQLGLSGELTQQSELQANISKAKFDIESKLQKDIAAQKEKFNSLDLDTQKRQQQANLDTIYTMTKQADEQKKITAEMMLQEQMGKELRTTQLAMATSLVDNTKEMMKMRIEAEGLLLPTREKIKLDTEAKSLLEGINATQQFITNSARLTTNEKEKYLEVLSSITSKEQLRNFLNDKNLDSTQTLTLAIQNQMTMISSLTAEQQKLYDNSRKFSTGWTQAFNQYIENGTNAARIAGDMFNATTRNMESAIDRFVETGKFNFNDFTRSVLQDLLKIQLKAQMTQLIKAASGGSSGFLGKLLGFAEGGQPPINKPSIVGEKGPELFVPKTAGTIIPNGGSMNGSGMAQPTNNTYITNNISALDSRSVAQMFAENRKSLLGTVQLAQKEMPYSNR